MQGLPSVIRGRLLDRPRCVAEEPALRELLDRLTSLVQTALVGDGVAVGGIDRLGACCPGRTTTLPLYPGRGVDVYLVADLHR